MPACTANIPDLTLVTSLAIGNHAIPQPFPYIQLKTGMEIPV